MKLNALHMRFGAIAAGVLLLFLGGRAFFPSSDAKIWIEFGAYPEQFEGLPVEIDGKVAGTLARTGQVTRIAFPVSKGEHSVRLVHPKMECAATRVKADKPGASVHLLADVEERSDARGRMTPTLVLRN